MPDFVDKKKKKILMHLVQWRRMSIREPNYLPGKCTVKRERGERKKGGLVVCYDGRIVLAPGLGVRSELERPPDAPAPHKLEP